jgi:hypothetical protein
MKPRRVASAFSAVLWLAAPVLAAQDDTGERARIAAERTAAEATLAERERECSTRFVVTACVEEARSDYRATLDGLRRQQALLDEAERRQRAGERLDRLAAKAPPGGDVRAREAARAEAHAARIRATQERRAAVERRNAEREKKGKKAARPLPVPASGATP